MFVLVKYNSTTFDKLSKIAISKSYTPVPLYTLTLSKKKDENRGDGLAKSWL